MKQQLKNLMFLLLIVTFISCSHEADLKDANLIYDGANQLRSNNFILLEDALDEADKYFEAFYGFQTRSENKFKSVEILRRQNFIKKGLSL